MLAAKLPVGRGPIAAIRTPPAGEEKLVFFRPGLRAQKSLQIRQIQRLGEAWFRPA